MNFTNSIHTITVPALTPQEKAIHIAVGTIAIALLIIGTLALLASNGLAVGNIADVGVRFGYICFFIGTGTLCIQGYILSTKKEQVYSVANLSDQLIRPTQKRICCATRFTHGPRDTRNPLLDTWQNITLMDEGGFRPYPPLPEQKPRIYGPSPVTPMKDRVGIRWMGHASFLIETENTTILTDPNWSDRIPFLGPTTLYYRSLPPGLPYEEMPPVKNILTTHTHADHLDPKTVTRFSTDPKHQSDIYCPAGAKPLLSNCTHVTEMSWWDKIVLKGGTEIEFVPTDHASQTTATDCNKYLWGGYVISIPLGHGKYFRIFQMGDTACNINPSIKGFKEKQWQFDSQLFDNIVKKYPDIDVLLYPTDPVWGQEDKHSNVFQAIDFIRRKLKPKMVIPMHWGTWPFNEFGRDLEAPVRILEEAFQQEGPDFAKLLHRMKVGEYLTLIPA